MEQRKERKEKRKENEPRRSHFSSSSFPECAQTTKRSRISKRGGENENPYLQLLGRGGKEKNADISIIAALARIAADVNQSVENIGARRLYTVMERVFEELSFNAPDRAGDGVTINAEFVEDNLGELAKGSDMSRYVL